MPTSAPPGNEMPPMFARSILGGKKTAKVEARVTDDVKEAVRRRWMDLCFNSESEYLEMLLTMDCFGKDHVRMIRLQQVERVCGLSDNAPAGEGTAT